MEDYMRKALRAITLAETFVDEGETTVVLAGIKALLVGGGKLYDELDEPGRADILAKIPEILAMFRDGQTPTPPCPAVGDESVPRGGYKSVPRGGYKFVGLMPITTIDPKLLVLQAHMPGVLPTALHVQRKDAVILVDAEGRVDGVGVHYHGMWSPFSVGMADAPSPTSEQVAAATFTFDPTSGMLDVRMPVTPLVDVDVQLAPGTIAAPPKERPAEARPGWAGLAA